MTLVKFYASLLAIFVILLAGKSLGHDLSADNAAYVQGLEGTAVIPFLYLGAKHMFTGYDHLLFLLGVIFFLYRPKHIILYVTLFTLGHSITLFLGVWGHWQVSGHLVDAIIGLSIVYKAFENIGGFKLLWGFNPDTRVAVFVFGLCHGLGLATKLQGYIASGDSLMINLLSFNLGVELGQLLALSLILIILLQLRRYAAFQSRAFAINIVLMCAGFILAGNEFAGYLFA